MFDLLHTDHSDAKRIDRKWQRTGKTHAQVARIGIKGENKWMELLTKSLRRK